MIKLIKNNFRKTNDCIILVTPLIIFLSIIGWYTTYAFHSVNNIIKLILAVVTLLVMTSGLFSAWLYMAKKTIALADKIFVFDKDRIKAIGELILSLPKGIGKLFLPIFSLVSTYLVIVTTVFSVIGIALSKLIGTINYSKLTLANIFVDSNTLYEEFSNLSIKALMTLDLWIILFIIVMVFVSHITFLWIPEIVYSEKNPFKALKNSVIKIFNNFKDVTLLFLYAVLINLLIACCNTILMINPILYFIVLMIYYYSQVYLLVLIFTYYEQTFIRTE